MKKRILALLLVLTLLVLGGCTVRDTVQVMGISVTTLQELADAALSEDTEAPESGEQFVTAEDPEVTQTADTVDAHGYYYDAVHVVLYLDAYGHLPEKTGRTYTECDINTLGADSRGAERLIFSNDGLYFYTSNHYASFTELTVDGGTVIWN